MKYILMRTVSGKTYYAGTEENNAIKKNRGYRFGTEICIREGCKKNAGPGKQET